MASIFDDNPLAISPQSRTAATLRKLRGESKPKFDDMDEAGLEQASASTKKRLKAANTDCKHEKPRYAVTPATVVRWKMICNLCADLPKHPKTLVKETGIDRRKLHPVLRSMVERKFLRRVGDGTLTYTGKPVTKEG